MTDKKKILIIGAGLAGSSLAHRLLQQEHYVTIIDKGENVATSVAAGMVNPMVFRRTNKSWRLDEFLPEAKEFYLSL
jgi:flavin-dependent dehydrogenase